MNTILVTGAGGDVGIGVGHALRDSRFREHALGADARPSTIPSELFSVRAALPFATAPDYLDRLRERVVTLAVTHLIPGSDAETAILLESGWLQEGRPVRVVAPNAAAVRAGLDKLQTADELAAHGIPVPWTRSALATTPYEFPCILKPRSGQGSKGLCTLTSARDIPPDVDGTMVFQEYLDGAEGEFTCGVYRTRAGEVRSITFRRTLVGGRSDTAVVIDDRTISSTLERIALALDLTGSINVQLRLKAGVPMVFEINPRFSSTVALRHQLGFQDVVWAIEDSSSAALRAYAPPLAGQTFSRRPDGTWSSSSEKGRT